MFDLQAYAKCKISQPILQYLRKKQEKVVIKVAKIKNEHKGHTCYN